LHKHIYIYIFVAAASSFLPCQTLKKRWGEREAHLNVSRRPKESMHKCIMYPGSIMETDPMSEKMEGTWEGTYNLHFGLEWVN
jgi:hypothetical protein